IRRAMSCAYCAPKSTTRTVSCCVVMKPGTRLASPAHADALAALERLALGQQRRRHHDLGLLELLQRLVAGGGHRGTQRAEQVERAVVLVRGTDQDLLEGLLAPGEDTRA